jgi:hypothetical protein
MSLLPSMAIFGPRWENHLKSWVPPDISTTISSQSTVRPICTTTTNMTGSMSNTTWKVNIESHSSCGYIPETYTPGANAATAMVLERSGWVIIFLLVMFLGPNCV